MKRHWIMFVVCSAAFLFAHAASACPVGVHGIAAPNSTVCAESSSGALRCDTADASGNFNIIGGAVAPSTSWGCLPVTGTFWFYQVDCYNDGMSVNRDVSSEQYGGSWLDVTCQPSEPVHEPKVCLLATEWGTGVGHDTNLLDVNMTTGATSNPRPTGLGNVIGLAIHPSNTLLYAVTTFAAGPQSNSLYEIDMATGASTLVGALGIGNISEGDLAFGDDGTLYGIMGSKLYTVDTSTGAATLVGNPYGSDYSYLSFNGSDTMFGIDNSSTPGQIPTTLDEINETNASVVTSQVLSPNLGGYGGMDWYQLGNWMWVADGKNPGSPYTGHRKLFRLNTSTGALTTVGSLGLTHGVGGLAACKPCAVETSLGDPKADTPGNAEALTMAYRVRDELLRTTRIGEHYIDRFYDYSLRMVYLMARDHSLALETADFLRSMTPGFLDLLDGEGRRHEVTDEQVESAQRLASRFAEADQEGSGKLARAIDEELHRVDLDRLRGLGFAEAWAYLNTLPTDEEGSSER